MKLFSFVSLLKKNIFAVPFLFLFALPFLIAIGLLTGYSNKQIVIKNRAAETNSLAGFAIYKTFSNLPNPEFRLETKKALLLGADSSVFVSTAEKGVGLVKNLPEKKEVPLILKAKLLVISGRVHFSLVDDRGREIYAGEVKAENKWQELSAEIPSERFAEEEFKLKEIRIYAADQNTSWYINNVSLNNFDQQQEQTSFSGTFAPIPPPYNLRVMLVSLNPEENGENLVDHFNLGWGMSASTVEDTLARNIVSDFKQLSNNKINYQVVKKLNISSFPPFLNGYNYNFTEYSRCLNGDPGGVCEHQKVLFDYIDWVRNNQICETADSENVDAIWLITPAYLGNWENFLIGPNTGFNVNGGFYIIPECQRHYMINTANYTGNANYLHISHIFGHAVEVIMEYYVSLGWTMANKNKYWEDFTQFNYLYGIPIGEDAGPFSQTFCGNVHWTSNGIRHGDFGNTTFKDFSCRDWKNFPVLRGDKEYINCERWGCLGGNKWETYWLSMLPDYWWSFLLLPDEAIRYRRAGAPIPYTFSNCKGQYFGFDQCDARADKSKPGLCQLNPALGAINPSDPNDPINTWKWSYCLLRSSSTPTPTVALPTLRSTQTPTILPRPTSTPTPGSPRLNCQGQYFGKPQCDARASTTYGKGGICQLNPALGSINPSNPNDPINTWKWSYCK